MVNREASIVTPREARQCNRGKPGNVAGVDLNRRGQWRVSTTENTVKFGCNGLFRTLKTLQVMYLPRLQWRHSIVYDYPAPLQSS